MADHGTRVGTGFGPYRLDALLGYGGMGEVYRAHDTVHDREVALKLLHEHLAGDATYQERFRREAQAVAKLGEPHIIPIHDFGEIDGVLYLDMRLVEGEDLRARLRRTGPMSPADAVAIVEQVAAALDAAHAAGLAHRDVKPENVLVTASDFAYLVDFGIAHQGADTHLTQAGTAIGSLAYMAPEQLDGVAAGPVSDVYSLAAVTFEALTGTPPFPGATVSQIVRATVMNDVPSPRQRSGAVSPQLDAVVMRGLAKSPDGRFSSAGAFARAARSALEGQWPDDAASPTTAIQTDPAYDRTMIGERPTTTPITGPQSYSSPQAYSAPQTYSAPQPVSPPYTPPPAYSRPPGPPMSQSPSVPPQYYPGLPPVDSGGAGRSLQVVLSVLIGLLVLALIGVGIYWVGFRTSDGPGQAAPSSTTTLTQTVPPSPTVAPTPPPGTEHCSAEVGVVGGVTSCAFAANVRTAYLAGGSEGEARTVTAASPVTGQNYAMACAPETGVVVCRGGNNAVVVIF